jgi:hypothetical protein
MLDHHHPGCNPSHCVRDVLPFLRLRPAGRGGSLLFPIAWVSWYLADGRVDHKARP